MELNRFLQGIDVSATDENQINDFLEKNENDIKSFILGKWDEFIQTSTPIIDSTNQENMEEVVSESSPDVEVVSEAIPEVALVIEEKEKSSENMQNNKKEDQLEKNKIESFSATLRSKFISLPNGKVNQSYKAIFDIKQLGFPDIEDFWFTGLEEIGLAFTDKNEIIGVPTKPGDFKIYLEVKYKGWTEGKPIIRKDITIIINPDPRSLWNNIPTPVNVDYYKPDSNKQFVRVKSTGFFKSKDRKDIVVASQRGRSHAHEGKPRDDDFGVLYDTNTEWYILSVADGAGSAISSRRGSEIACKTFVAECQMHLKNQQKGFEKLIEEYSKEKSDTNKKKLLDQIYNIVGTSVFKAYKDIEEEAKTINKPIKDFSTTLIVSVCKRFKFGWFVAAFWVGDGGIGIYSKESQYVKILGESDGGEFAGQTRFLTMPEIVHTYYSRLRFEIVSDFTSIILMTDGISDPKFETDSNLLKVEKWNDLWADLSKEVDFTDDNEKSADQLLKWLDFWSPGNHDDRTIAILY